MIQLMHLSVGLALGFSLLQSAESRAGSSGPLAAFNYLGSWKSTVQYPIGNECPRDAHPTRGCEIHLVVSEQSQNRYSCQAHVYVHTSSGTQERKAKCLTNIDPFRRMHFLMDLNSQSWRLTGDVELFRNYDKVIQMMLVENSPSISPSKLIFSKK